MQTIRLVHIIQGQFTHIYTVGQPARVGMDTFEVAGIEAVHGTDDYMVFTIKVLGADKDQEGEQEIKSWQTISSKDYRIQYFL